MRKRTDGRWEDRFTINGRRVSVYGKTKGECQQNVRKWLEENHRRRQQEQLMNGIIDEWYSKWSVDKSPATIHSRSSVISRIRKVYGDQYVFDITAKDITKDLAKYSESAVEKTIKNYRDILSLIFDYAMTCEFITVNPSRLSTMPKAKKPGHRRPLTHEEAEVLKKGFSTEKGGLFSAIMFYTGMRPEEVRALMWEDIRDGIIHVSRSGNGSTKTPAGIRDIPLLKPLEDILSQIINRKKYVVGYDTIICEQSPQVWFKQLKKDLGLPEDITLYSLRHNFCTILYEANVDVKTASAIMGHASIEITQEVYTHLRDEHKEKEFNKLRKSVEGSVLGS